MQPWLVVDAEELISNAQQATGQALGWDHLHTPAILPTGAELAPQWPGRGLPRPTVDHHRQRTGAGEGAPYHEDSTANSAAAAGADPLAAMAASVPERKSP